MNTKLPTEFLSSLETAKGFDRIAFEAAHTTASKLTSIRLNPFKVNMSEGFQLHSIEKHQIIDWKEDFTIEAQVAWAKQGYYLASRPFFTLDPLIHAGAYYVQEASSMFLWEVLKQVVGNETDVKVLDVCAAPGGKSSLLASYCTDGLVVANEVIKSRNAILVENLTKWGMPNVVVTNNDPKELGKLSSFFDLVVVDAPCSGSGLFRKDEDAIKEWSLDHVALCSNRQERILADILPALKEEGVLIYSTCSFSKAENEEMMDWLMELGELESVPIKLATEWGIVAAQSEIYGAAGYRFYPDKVKGEGFFISVFRKKVPSETIRKKELLPSLPSKNELQALSVRYTIPDGYAVFKQNEALRLFPERWLGELMQPKANWYIKKAGIEIGHIKGKDLIPSHELAVSILTKQDFESVEIDCETALQYLRRNDILVNSTVGWKLISYKGLGLGWIKALPNRINNYYPTEWRILKQQ